MKKTAIFTLSLLAMTASAQDGPTMGWSSWNTYGINISDDLIRRQADAMVSTGLKDVGFDHVNIDDGFFGGRDANGVLLIHPTRFPNGLKPVADYIHSKGLKAGIYSDAGANTCGNKWAGDKWGENAGLYQHDQQDIDFYMKDCGFDFIKVDFCGGRAHDNTQGLDLDPQERYTAIAEAIKATGKNHVRMNVCRWDYPGTWVSDVAFSWRTTFDIYDSWEAVKKILAENLYLAAYCEKGRFNDMDMLEVGRSMTEEEDKTHFGMWCMMNSPLLIGCDLENIRQKTLNLLKNKDLISLNQDKLYQQAYLVSLTNGCHVLVKDIEQRNGTKRAFAIYNPNDGRKSVTVKFADLCLGGSVKLRDAFEQKDLGEFSEQYTVSVPAHGTRIYIAEAENRLERVRYEAETAYISDYQELKNNQTERTGIYEKSTNCSAGYKATWLGMSEENDLIFRDVYSRDGGEYTLTIGFVSGDNRNIAVSVNGEVVETVVTNGGSWSQVSQKKVAVRLNQGNNTVRLSNATGWMPDIDYIDLVPTVPSSIGVAKQQPLAADEAVYDLQGRKIHKKKEKIYVKRGRKIIEN
ncbi:MAG: alpha-galactosidase [Prevotella sp.]|nr:alpha-galactosidase [Prevotella sp.]